MQKGRLALIFLALLVLSACAQTPAPVPQAPRVPWYQRTTSQIMGFVRHEDVVDGHVRRFGCLFTNSSVTIDTDALMCFEPTTRYAAIWLVGLRPAHCNEQGCVIALEGDKKEAMGTRLPLEVTPINKGVYGLYQKDSTLLYDMTYDAGFNYTLHVFTDQGMKAFTFSVPETYRF